MRRGAVAGLPVSMPPDGPKPTRRDEGLSRGRERELGGGGNGRMEGGGEGRPEAG